MEFLGFKPQMASTVPVKLAIFASTDGATAGATQQEFWDRFLRFQLYDRLKLFVGPHVVHVRTNSRHYSAILTEIVGSCDRMTAIGL